MDSLYKSRIRGKLYRLFYEMNKDVEIKVKTPVGVSDKEHTGPILAQGSIEAAMISSNNVSVGIEETFEDNEREIEYAGTKLNPFSYMDDVLRGAESVEDAQYGNDLMEELIGKKNLQLNLDKSSYLIMGNRKKRKLIESKLEKNPLTLNGIPMKEAKEIKYLGDYR